MKLKLLNRRHTDYDPATLRLYADLFAGGAQFRRNIKDYLPQNDIEPNDLWQKRLKRAHYLNYAARICNFFASWLFSAPLTFDPGVDSGPQPLGTVPSPDRALKAPPLDTTETADETSVDGTPAAPGAKLKPLTPPRKPFGAASVSSPKSPVGQEPDDDELPTTGSPTALPPGAGDPPPPFGIDDPWYAKFKEDCDGAGTDFDRFIRDRFVDALIRQSAFVRLGYRDPETAGVPPEDMVRKDWRDAGGDDLVLVPILAENVVNWRRNPDKSLAWLVEYTKRCELIEFDDESETVTETWTRWAADGTVTRWERVYQHGAGGRDLGPGGKTDDVPEVDAPQNPCDGCMPIVELQLPAELWLMDNLADPQLEHFRARNALAWSIYRTCYVMALLKTKSRARKPLIGSGYYLQMGIDEDLTWPAPPGAPYDTIKAYAAELKDELHRVADQMAQGTDNSAAAIGRSAESKNADNSSTEIVLGAYGALVRETVERVMDLVAIARGDDYEWSITGMANYKVTDADVLANTALAIQPLNIPSPTFQRELHKKLALAIVSDADETTRSRIAAEIDHHTVDEHVLNPMTKQADQMRGAGIDPNPPPPPADGDDSEDDGPPAKSSPSPLQPPNVVKPRPPATGHKPPSPFGRR